VGALLGLGIPEGTARYFEEGVRRGSVLLVVSAGDRQDVVMDILRFSQGDLGHAAVRATLDAEDDEPCRGGERRYRDDPRYLGPERRFAART
jgi:hypothetical protein